MFLQHIVHLLTHVFQIQGFTKFKTHIMHKYAIAFGHQRYLLSGRDSEEMKLIEVTSGVYSIRDGTLIDI